MPTIVRNRDQAVRWVKAKQRNEQEMLRRLNYLFDGERPRRLIADLLTPAIAAMWLEDRLHQEQHHFGSPIISAVMSEDLPVWELCNRNGPPLIAPEARLLRMWEMLRTHDPQLTCAHLSELMRSVGGWLEKGGGFASLSAEHMHGADQVEGASHMYDELRRLAPADVAHGDVAALTAIAGDALEAGGGFGTEDINKAFRVGDSWTGDVRQRDRLQHEIEEHVRDAWVRPAFNRDAGMQMKRADRDDLCKKIDRLFGLLVGATISGTTADIATILEGLGAPRGLHAGYYLFPVATMAAALHHTLLEVALPLVLIGAIDKYSIGFYKTLKPKGGFPDELKPAEDLLRQGEEDQRNRHFVLWYDGHGAVEGCVLWHRDEYDLAKDTLYDGKKALIWAREIKRAPQEKDTARIISKVSPLLWERLPVSFKKAAYN